jgi:hypothetical protein
VDSHGKKRSAPEDGQATPGGKKPYRAPQLTEYGSVAKLTQSNAGSGADGGMKASQMMTCL